MDSAILERFKKDKEYYDVENKELEAITSICGFKSNQHLIDVGAGIGRLSLTLCDYINVTALDSNNELLSQIKNPKIKKINQKIEHFLPEEKFDYALIAWPQFNNHKEIFKHIKNNILKKEGNLIVLKSISHDLKVLAKKISPETQKSQRLFDSLLHDFYIIKENKIQTKWVYPEEEEALKIVSFELKEFFGKNLKKHDKKLIKNFLKLKQKENSYILRADLNVFLCESKTS